MSFIASVSGLNGTASALDVTSNNIANGSTTGFKKSDTRFADIFSSATQGSTALGTSAESHPQRFTQGAMLITDKNLDIAISGNGMFQLKDLTAAAGEQISYTRDGQFGVYSDPAVTDGPSSIVNADKRYLMGWATGTATTQAPSPLEIPKKLAGTPTTATDLTVNLDLNNPAPQVTVFDPAEPRSFNSATSQVVYDSEGSTHTLMTYFAHDPAAKKWNVYTRLDGVAPSEEATGPRQISFSTVGHLAADTKFTSTFSTANISPMTTDLSASTQFASPFSYWSSKENGQLAGVLDPDGISVASDGSVTARYTKGINSLIVKAGTVALANFNDPNGLQQIGSSSWTSTEKSGAPSFGVPGGNSGHGLLQAGALENSNVDITNELFNLITLQRSYQANSQAIKTQDQMLQTLVGMK